MPAPQAVLSSGLLQCGDGYASVPAIPGASSQGPNPPMTPPVRPKLGPESAHGCAPALQLSLWLPPTGSSLELLQCCFLFLESCFSWPASCRLCCIKHLSESSRVLVLAPPGTAGFFLWGSHHACNHYSDTPPRTSMRAGSVLLTPLFTD